MKYSKPIKEIMDERYSCRSYSNNLIENNKAEELNEFFSANSKGPFNGESRFELVAASGEDSNTLKKLGTYGTIKGATGFIIGAMKSSEKDLEDFGYLMERNILMATDKGLGTCWLGGSFSKSGFSNKIGVGEDELVPAVASTGYIAKKVAVFDSITRWGAGSKKRKFPEELFYLDNFNTPLGEADAGKYALPLEMVRLAPSASNKQPWRIIKEKNKNVFHLYLQRTGKYYERNKLLFKLADMQRIDMGIAMCHFELTALEAGLKGSWKVNDPEIGPLPKATSYVVSWVGK
ncbi:MAG: nitroreductase [bacterium]|nr:nitroreductase [bacterium]